MKKYDEILSDDKSVFKPSNGRQLKQELNYFNLDAGIVHRVQEFSLFISQLSQFYIIKSKIFDINKYVDYYDYLGKLKGLHNVMIIPLTHEVYNELHI